VFRLILKQPQYLLKIFRWHFNNCGCQNVAEILWEILWLFRINFNRFSCRVHRLTRGDVYKLYKPSCTNTTRSHFFACHVISVWNSHLKQ